MPVSLGSKATGQEGPDEKVQSNCQRDNRVWGPTETPACMSV